jgi:hypothetical protein
LKIRPAAIFSFCALVFFCVFVYQAQEWRLQARLYPYAIGIPMIILALIQVILDLMGYVAKQSDDAAPVDFQATKTVAPEIAFKRTVTTFGWFLGFFAGIWLLGFSITIPAMVFSYMYFQGKEKLMLAATLTAIAYVFFWALFVKLLNLPFPDGQVQTWLGLT